MSVPPKVSVLIPTYNYAHFLDETIRCVLDQTLTDFELVIIDNCSTDNTEEVVKKYLSDSRVRFHRNERNLGLAGNWNKSFDFARGEYIKFLCADDKIHPQMLEKFVAIMDQRPNIALITSYCELFGELTKTIKKPFAGEVSGLQAIKNSLFETGRNWFGEPTAYMFRRAHTHIGRFNPQLHSHIDWEFCVRLLTQGDCYIVPETLYYVRHHPQTQTAQVKAKKFEHAFSAYKLMKAIKNTNQFQKDSMSAELNTLLKKRASRCAAVMYKVTPGLYRKENRRIFKRAFQIGYAEGVLFTPFVKLLKSR